jgi:glucose-1-phosphatase
MTVNWFLFDLGNTLIKLAYERVIENIRRDTSISRDSLVALLEQSGGYRDLERGEVSFAEFYDFLVERAGYRASIAELRTVWCDFFDGPVDGIEELLDRVREQYRVAFLSNSNEVHAELIPRRFATLFDRDDRFIFSYRFRVAKPDPRMFKRALEVIGSLPQHVVFVDDLIENVMAARACGMQAFLFTTSEVLARELETAGILSPQR